MTRVQLQPFESRLEIIYLSGLTTKDLEARLATLPEDSIVYYLVVYRGWGGPSLQSNGVRGPSRGRCPCAHLYLGRCGHGSRHRRRQPSRPAGHDGSCRQSGDPGAPRRAGGQHPDIFARSACQSGRLAPASALGHQRSARPRWNARQVPRALGLGSLQGLHSQRSGAPAGADRR